MQSLCLQHIQSSVFKLDFLTSHTCSVPQAGRREGMLQQVDCSPAVNSIFWLSKCEAWLGCKPPAGKIWVLIYQRCSLLLEPATPASACEGVL